MLGTNSAKPPAMTSLEDPIALRPAERAKGTVRPSLNPYTHKVSNILRNKRDEGSLETFGGLRRQKGKVERGIWGGILYQDYIAYDAGIGHMVFCMFCMRQQTLALGIRHFLLSQ